MLFIMKPSRKDVKRRRLRNVQGGNRGVKEPVRADSYLWQPRCFVSATRPGLEGLK